MDVRIAPSRLSGTTRAPPSKSYTHRAILAAGYGEGGRVLDPLLSADTRATAGTVEAFGGAVREADDGRHLTVEGFDGRPAVPGDVLDCGNSGTTIRLATAAAALAEGLTVLTGDDSLRSRPHGPLLDAVEQLGGRAESTRRNGRAPLVVGGPVAGGSVAIPGDVSSQFVTALLMAGAVTGEGIRVDLETELKSAPYVDVTLEVMDAFGVEARAVRREGNPTDDAGGASDGDAGGSGASDGGDLEGFAVEGGQRYDPGPDGYQVPGDFSSISYLLAAGALAAPDGLRVENARPGAQGDAAIVDVLERMGARIDWDREAGRIDVRQSPLSGVTVDVGDTPDLLPTVAALGAAADGDTRIENCEHVRYKETDRVRAMAEELDGMGASVTEREDELVVHGGESDLRGGRVDGRGDHRIVMACAVAALVAEGETTVRGAEHVDVSFPGFFDVLRDLGASVEELG